METPKDIKEMREVCAAFLKSSPQASQFWDLITGLRGPDSPSERPNMSPAESGQAYKGRRERKARTVEVIRHHAFGGVIGGAARSRGDRNYVELPSREKWDHFDKHVERAAKVLGLEVRICKEL